MIFPLSQHRALTSFFQFFFQESWRVALLRLRYFFRSSSRKHLAATSSALRTDVDDVVGKFYYVEVVLDDDNGIALIHELLNNIHQNANVFEVQTRSRLVEDVESLARVALSQFCSQFHTLAFASRESSRRLSELDIAQSYLLKG